MTLSPALLMKEKHILDEANLALLTKENHLLKSMNPVQLYQWVVIQVSQICHDFLKSRR